MLELVDLVLASSAPLVALSIRSGKLDICTARYSYTVAVLDTCIEDDKQYFVSATHVAAEVYVEAADCATEMDPGAYTPEALNLDSPT